MVRIMRPNDLHLVEAHRRRGGNRGTAPDAQGQKEKGQKRAFQTHGPQPFDRGTPWQEEKVIWHPASPLALWKLG